MTPLSTRGTAMASFSRTNHHRLTNHGPNIVTTTTSHSSDSMTHHTATTHKLQSLAAVATVLLQRYHQDDVNGDDENDNKENDTVPPLNYHDTIMTGTSSLKCQFRKYHRVSSIQPRTNTNRIVLGSLHPDMRSVVGPTTEPPPRRAMENAGREKDTKHDDPTRRTTSIASENDENDDHHEEEEGEEDYDTEEEDEDSAVDSVHFSTSAVTEHDDEDEDDDKVDEDETPLRPTAECTTTTTTTATSTTRYYYMDQSWIPLTTNYTASTGGSRITSSSRSRPLSKQVSPNTIRVQIRQYMIEHPEKRKTKLLADLGVNSNSFRKFMDPYNYKEPWRAVENGTYLAAARYLEAERVHPHRSDTSVVLPSRTTTVSPKTQSTTTPTTNQKEPKKRTWLPPSRSPKTPPPPPSPVSKRRKTSHRHHARQYMTDIHAVPLRTTTTAAAAALTNENSKRRTHLALQIQEFLALPGVSKSNFCAIALNGINRKVLNKIVQGHEYHDDLWTEDLYSRVWAFFKKKRIYDMGTKALIQK